MKYAVVTGADRGVGLALVKQLLDRGFYVFAGQYNSAETALSELQYDCADRLSVVSLDIGSDISVAAFKQHILENTTSIDLLINNAGILGDIEKTVGDELDFDEMQKVINVNGLGTLRVSNALCDHILKSETRLIVNISSEAGCINDCWREGWFGYCMSKAANNMQSALVHNYMKSKGGKVIIFHPGHVATYMRGHLDTDAKITPDESAAGILKNSLDVEWPVGDAPLFIDYSGEKLGF